MQATQPTALHRWTPTLVGGPIAAFLGIFTSKVIDRLGWLDAPAEATAKLLQAGVTSGDLANWIGFVVFALLYALLLRWAWSGYRAAPPKAAAGGFTVTGTLTTRPPLKLTEADRERIAETLRDVFDFVGREVRPLVNKLVNAICGHDPPAFEKIVPLVPVQRQLAWNAMELHQKHSHYLDMIGLDVIPVYRGVSDLQTPMEKVVEALDWPPEAKSERATQLNYAFSALDGTLKDVESRLKALKQDYL